MENLRSILPLYFRGTFEISRRARGHGPDSGVRQPAYFDHANGTVALVAMTSTFEYYGRAASMCTRGLSWATWVSAIHSKCYLAQPELVIRDHGAPACLSLIKVLGQRGHSNDRDHSVFANSGAPADLADNLAAVIDKPRRNADAESYCPCTPISRHGDTWSPDGRPLPTK